MTDAGHGPLGGVRVVELPAIGPAPFAAMVLAGLGAEVVRIERPGSAPLISEHYEFNLVQRDRSTIVLNLKAPLAVEAVLRLVERSDVLIEGWRPGVAERLGVGPDACLGRNPRLVYGRMTGWGQTGPRSQTAGHDINYLALVGVLHAIGRAGDRPVPPLNLIADYGGGGMLLAMGVLAGVLESRNSGVGQVVDAAMIDGVAMLATALFGYVAAGAWNLTRGENLLDSGAPFYDVYETLDGRYVAVGAIEPQFFAELLHGLDLDPSHLPDQMDRARWPELRDAIAQAFRTRSRDEWDAVFAKTDACVTPVLTFEEAVSDAHNQARETFVVTGEVPQPRPSPRFARSRAEIRRSPAEPGADTRTVLTELGFDETELEQLVSLEPTA